LGFGSLRTQEGNLNSWTGHTLCLADIRRAGNFDTTREPDTKLTGLGHKRVDPFTTRLSCLNGSCHGSPAGDPPDPFMFFFFFSPNQSYHLYG
jgi:hypothetical protein